MATVRFSGLKYLLATRRMSSGVTACTRAGSVLMVAQPRLASRRRSCTISPKLVGGDGLLLQALDLLVERLLHVLGLLARLGDVAQLEVALVLVAALVGRGGVSDLLLEDERLVEAAGPAAQDAVHDGER